MANTADQPPIGSWFAVPYINWVPEDVLGWGAKPWGTFAWGESSPVTKWTQTKL